MSEYTEPYPEAPPDPCDYYGHLYNYFLEKPGETTHSTATPSTSHVSLPKQSMLVTGFGLRNLESLQRALLDDEQRRQMLLHLYDTGEGEYECSTLPSTPFGLTTTSSTQMPTSDRSAARRAFTLQYLLGLGDVQVEEEAAPEVKLPSWRVEVEGEGEEEDRRMTVAMRKARKYLREHRIFDFFKFVIAHMLSDVPENPIQFIMDLLDKCLMYRSGFGHPPLLFEKAHIEQLFYMMDRMRTGFIDKEQYESGMKTLGICMFDKNPPLTTDGLISQDFFVEEAYECLTDLFVEMIRSHGPPPTPPSLITPPPTEVDLLQKVASSIKGGE